MRLLSINFELSLCTRLDSTEGGGGNQKLINSYSKKVRYLYTMQDAQLKPTKCHEVRLTINFTYKIERVIYTTIIFGIIHPLTRLHSYPVE